MTRIDEIRQKLDALFFNQEPLVKEADQEKIVDILDDLAKMIPKVDHANIHQIKECLKRINTLGINPNIKNRAKKIHEVAEKELLLTKDQKIWPVTKNQRDRFSIDFFKAKFAFEDRKFDHEVYEIFSDEILDMSGIHPDDKSEALCVLDEIVSSQIEQRPINFELFHANPARIRSLFYLAAIMGMEFTNEDITKIFGISKVHQYRCSVLANEVLKSFQEGVRPDFANKLNNIADLHIVYRIVDWLGLSDFQKAYLEPVSMFNKSPYYLPIYPFPPTVQILDLNEMKQGRDHIDEFTHLKVIRLKAIDLTKEEIDRFPENLEELDIEDCNVSKYDFSRFKNLKVIRLKNVSGLTEQHIKDIPKTIQAIDLVNANSKQIDFTKYKELKHLRLIDPVDKGLSYEQMAKLPDGIEELSLANVDLQGMDFRKFQHLKTLTLASVLNFDQSKVEEISPNLEKLTLMQMDLQGVHLERFTNLKSVHIYSSTHVSREQMETITNQIEEIVIIGGDAQNVDFKRFKSLKFIELHDVDNLTNTQREEIDQLQITAVIWC